MATFVLNHKHEVVFWNKACEELTGISASDMIGTQDQWKPFYARKRQVLADVIIDNNFEDITALYSSYEQPVLLKNGLHSEGWYPDLNGRDRYIIFDATPIYDTSGELTVAIETLQDITELKRADEELQKSEKKYKDLFDSTLDGIYQTDADGVYISMNRAGARIFGYESPEEIIGKTSLQYWRDPKDRDVFMAELKIKKTVSTYHIKAKKKTGEPIELESSSRIIGDEKGKFLGIEGILRDITERMAAEEKLRRSEEAYRRIVETAGEGIWSLDDQERTTFVNTAMTKMLGYTHEEMIGTPLKRYIFDEDLENYRQRIEARHSGINEYFERRYRRKDGDACWCMLSATPMQTAEGQFVGSFLMCTDITKRKEMEESLRKSEEQLRHAQKMEAVGTLAGGIAHDFNNLLNVILGYGNMVTDNLEADSPSKDQMNEVLTAAEKAANLTRRLLVFSRKQIVDVKPINVNETILGLQKMLVRIIRENIDFKLDLADNCLVVMADAVQIEQVLMNLATNAKDAMPEGGRLTISTGIQEIDNEYVAANGYGEPGKYALITVSDTGHGMDAETQKNIFEPFFTTKGIGEGTGLGLAISYGIIKQHCGYIKVYSEPGQGTVFKIYLPLVGESTCLDKKTEAGDSVRGGNETILVAEDDASLRKLTRIVLESVGYTVITAENGEDAITKFMENRERIDLAMLDMIMPKKNGKEVSEVLRKMRARIKILFASGYTMDAIKTQKLIESGFDFILKPVRSQDLLKKVREILDK